MTVLVTGFICLLMPSKKDKAAEPQEESYYAFRYQWVAYISEGRCTGGPEKFGIVKCSKNTNPAVKLYEKLPKRDEDKPFYAVHATDKITEIPVFSSFTPITKEQFEVASKSKALTVNLE